VSGNRRRFRTMLVVAAVIGAFAVPMADAETRALEAKRVGRGTNPAISIGLRIDLPTLGLSYQRGSGVFFNEGVAGGPGMVGWGDEQRLGSGGSPSVGSYSGATQTGAGVFWTRDTSEGGVLVGRDSFGFEFTSPRVVARKTCNPPGDVVSFEGLWGLAQETCLANGNLRLDYVEVPHVEGRSSRTTIDRFPPGSGIDTRYRVPIASLFPSHTGPRKPISISILLNPSIIVDQVDGERAVRNRVLVYTSVDGGETWTRSVVRRTSAELGDVRLAAAVDSLHVVWTERADDASSDVWFRRCEPEGSPCDRPVQISAGSGSWVAQDVAACEDHVFVGYTHDGELWGRYSPDGGETWWDPFQVTGDFGPADHWRMVATDVGVHNVFHADDDGSDWVYYFFGLW